MEFDEGCEDEIAAKYRFRFLNQIFKSGDRVYLCPNQLPQPISLILKDGTPVPENVNLTWGGIANYTDNGSAITTVISLTNNLGGNVTCNVEGRELFLEFATVGLSAKIENGKEDNESEYDPNTFPNYPSHNTMPEAGIPWKFVEVGQDAHLRAKAIPHSSAFYAIELESDRRGLVINPSPLTTKGFNPITLEATNVVEEASISVCGSVLLKGYAANRKELTVDFFRVCELDDDGTANCPSQVSLNSYIKNLVDEANSTYNKAGVYLMGMGYETINVNYDIQTIDNTLNGNDEEEAIMIHPSVQASLTMGHIACFIVERIGTIRAVPAGQIVIVAGRAVDFGVNAVSIDRNYGNGETLAHEIGHGTFSLRHPDTDHNSLGFQSADLSNFMFSTREETNDAGTTFRGIKTKKYQWDVFHQH